MSKYARERKRLIRILKSQRLPSDPQSVKEWLRKAESKFWQDETESRVISLYRRQKRSIRPFAGGYARSGFANSFANIMYPGEWKPSPLCEFRGRLLRGEL